MAQASRIAGHLVLIFVMITTIANVCHCELESSSETLIKEEETVTLWCATGNDEEKCNWESPTGERCIVVHQEFADKSRCVDGATAAWSTYGNGNCTITITSEAIERNGDWKCSLNTALDDSGELSEGVVNLKIARSARVSVDPFGTLHLSEGANDTIECTAERGQPLGQFVWKIGEDKEDESAFVVHAIAETEVEEEDDGSFTATQRLMYIADMEHSGKKLHCIYEQRDEDGNNLFEGNQDDEDEVRIIVRYLEQPTDELETLPSAEEGVNYTITKEFMASPIPDSTKGEIMWEIGPIDGSDEPLRYQIPEITPIAIGKYIIEPLENTEEKHRYIARLTITDTTVYDQNNKYVLKIERKKDEDSLEFEEVKYEFQITVEPSYPNESVTDDYKVESASPVGIIVAVIVILILIIVIAVGLWYVRKEKKLCFAPAEQNVEKGKTRENATTEDQMTTQPLNYGGVPDEDMSDSNNARAASVPNYDDSGEAIASGANDIVVVKQTDGSFQATTLDVKVGKMTNFSTMVHSREGRKVKIQVNNLFVLENTVIEIGDSGSAFIMRPERSINFTSKEIEDMNLKDGMNEAAFVVEDLSLKIPFAIYLLNQNNRLVFTDVDGTITTADVKGFIGGVMGFDVHHDGAVELFEKADKNGYTMIYLSARPMGAFNEDTRQYLFETLRPNDKGFNLPIAPLLLSNVLLLEGAMEAADPSDTKAATIRSIVDMFDLKEHVVSAGYGNQDSDAKAYVKSGIEERKVFIVNNTSRMVNYGTGEETSYKEHVQNIDSMYPRLRTGITDL